MTISETRNNNDLTIALSGRLDTTTAPELDDYLAKSLGGVANLAFDLKDLEYISSAGLRCLLSAKKKMKNSVKVRNVNDVVSEIFEITGFTEILDVE